MNQRRSAKASKIEETTSSAMWKVKSPGPEQRELERMIRSNDVQPGDTADETRRSNEMFMRFSASVFGNHFRATKAKVAKEGRYATVSAVGDANGMPELGGSGNFIPELGGSGESSSDKIMPARDFHSQRQSSINFPNPPYWVWKYFDHVLNMEFVCVAVVSISGFKNVELAISEDGFTLYIHYVWPTAIFRPAELFAKATNADGTPLSMNHPKVHSFVANALDNGVNKLSNPKGEIVIELPQKVQRVPSTYRIEAMYVGNTNVVMIELSSYHKAAVIEEANNAIIFK